MMRFSRYLFVVLVLTYTSPAFATDCYRYWNKDIPVPTGFASSFDVFVPAQQLITVDCNSPPNVSLVVGAENLNTQAIYKTAYLSKDGTTWTPVTLTSTHTVLSTNYFEASATATLNLTALELDNWNYIAFLVAYKKTDGTWIYGCRDSTCASAAGWNLQAITTNTITPEAVAISLSPPSSTVSNSAPSGTVISTATVTMSDGSTFSGTLSITGTSFLAIVGNNVVLQRNLTSGDDGTYTATVTVN